MTHNLVSYEREVEKTQYDDHIQTGKSRTVTELLREKTRTVVPSISADADRPDDAVS